MSQTRVEQHAQDIFNAIELIKLGARMQVLESLTQISREKLSRLYREIKGQSPAKGILPFSTDWFMTWQANIHSSLFANIYHTAYPEGKIDAQRLASAYHIYLDMIEAIGIEPVLSVTRAWTLLRFMEAELLQRTSCMRCHGLFITHAHEPAKHFVCGMCNMPSRANACSSTMAKKSLSKHQRAKRAPMAMV